MTFENWTGSLFQYLSVTAFARNQCEASCLPKRFLEGGARLGCKHWHTIAAGPGHNGTTTKLAKKGGRHLLPPLLRLTVKGSYL